MRHDESLVSVAEFNTVIEARVAMGRLESAGIRCVIEGENTLSVNPLYGVVLGGLKLQVPEASAQEATKLLQERPTPLPSDFKEACPLCGGELEQQHCKVFCAKCGHLVYNCSEF